MSAVARGFNRWTLGSYVKQSMTTCKKVTRNGTKDSEEVVGKNSNSLINEAVGYFVFSDSFQ